MTTYELGNGDASMTLRISNRTLAKGDSVVIPVTMTQWGSTWNPAMAAIEPGTYRVVSRKHFRAGYLLIERVGK